METAFNVTKEHAINSLNKRLYITEPGMYEVQFRSKQASGDGRYIFNTNVLTPYYAEQADKALEAGDYTKAYNQGLSYSCPDTFSNIPNIGFYTVCIVEKLNKQNIPILVIEGTPTPVQPKKAGKRVFGTTTNSSVITVEQLDEEMSEEMNDIPVKQDIPF